MDRPRWRDVEALFHEALARDPAEREAFVASAAEGDHELADAVRAMLEEDARGTSVLDRDRDGIAAAVLDDDAHLRLPGHAFGPYRPVRVLGEGGMGIVYLAERDDLQSVAAIKVLRDAALSPSGRARFEAEQRTLARLHHPAIAALYDASALPDGTPWFAMEYVAGVPLTTYVRERRTSLEGRLRLFRSVCEAVLHAHRHAVVHRDLKPSNILVDGSGAVKLLDFGIARPLDQADGDARRTKTGLRLFTPAYAAPEMLRDGMVGTYSDIYALGVVLYELLTGRLPFDPAGRSDIELAAAILDGEPLRPSSLARARAGRLGPLSDGVTASRAKWSDLDVLCMTAMQRDPARRYAAVDTIIRDIDHFLAGEPLAARPESLRYRLAKFTGRHRHAVAAAGIGLVVVTGLAVASAVRLAAARDDALAEAARTQRIQTFLMNLLRGDDDEGGAAEDLRVLDLVDRGRRDARQLDREPDAQAELHETLGTMYQRLGKLDIADDLLRQALEGRRRAGGNDASVGRAMIALGVLRSEQARHDEAESAVREGLARVRRQRPADHLEVVDGLAALGHVLEERGDYDRAIEVLEEADRLCARSHAESGERLAILGGLANNHFYAGRYETADELTRRSLALSRTLYGESHPTVAGDLVNLGAIRVQRGAYAEAEQLDRQALTIIEKWYGADHPRTAAALTMLGRALVYQEKRDEAARLLGRALVIRERVFGADHPRVASTLNELGTIALGAGRLDDAAALFERTLRIQRAAFGDRHDLVATALSNLASVCTARREFARAEPLYREALAIYGERLGAGHTNTAIAHIKLGRALLGQKRFAEAARESRSGYDTLSRQADPAVSFLRAARSDLAQAYAALGDQAEAARFRAELATPR